MKDNTQKTLPHRHFPGNQPLFKPNGGRPYVHRPGFSYIAKRRKGDKPSRKVQVYLDALRLALIEDASDGQGADALPAMKLILIDRAVGLLGVLRMIEAQTAETGAFQNDDLSGQLATTYLQYQASLRQTLSMLGVERTPSKDEPLDLADYLQRKAAAAVSPRQGEARSEEHGAEQPSSKIVDPRASSEGISEAQP